MGLREWQASFEQCYTLVHWDQRGCGNTFYRNPKAKKPTLDLLLSDLDDLVQFVEQPIKFTEALLHALSNVL